MEQMRSPISLDTGGQCNRNINTEEGSTPQQASFFVQRNDNDQYQQK